MSSGRLLRRATVVWEWQNSEGKWRPYSAAVVQLLERALAKGLKWVYLGDAEPLLSDISINLSLRRQFCKSSEREITVRRCLYCAESAAARGITWQWCESGAAQWHSYDMQVQCVLEHVHAAATVSTLYLSVVDARCTGVVDFNCMTDSLDGSSSADGCRNIRRHQQAPYPLVKVASSESVYTPPSVDELDRLSTAAARKDKKKRDREQQLWNIGRRRIMKRLTKLSSRLVDSLDRDDNSAVRSCVTTLSGSTVDSRRLSVATMSTYVSHGSDAGHFTHSLLDTSLPLAPAGQVTSSASDHDRPEHDVATLEHLLLLHTAVVTSGDESNNYCCVCDREMSLCSPHGDFTALQFVSCRHHVHLDCLRTINQSCHQCGYLECVCCGAIYGCKTGEQLSGRMSTRLLPIPLAGYEDDTIEISYTLFAAASDEDDNHRSRPSSAESPRVSYLPNTARGRHVLRLLEEAWRRRLVFNTSPTSGDAHFTVVWNPALQQTTDLHSSRRLDLDLMIKQLMLLGVT